MMETKAMQLDICKSTNADKFFSGDQICLILPYESLREKLRIKRLIVENGGKLTFAINKETTLVICSSEGPQPSRVDMALRIQLSVVTIDYVDACIQAGRRLSPNDFLLVTHLAKQAFLRGKVFMLSEITKQSKASKTDFSADIEPCAGDEDFPYQSYNLIKAIILKGTTISNWFSLELLYDNHAKFCIASHELPKDRKQIRYSSNAKRVIAAFNKLARARAGSMTPVWDDFPNNLGSPLLQNWRIYSGDVDPSILQLVEVLWQEALGPTSSLNPNSPITLDMVDEAEAILGKLLKAITANDKDESEKLSSKFYSILGSSQVTPLSSLEAVGEKINLCQLLRDGLFVNEGVKLDHPESKYFSLQCNISHISDPYDEEYKRVTDLLNSSWDCHNGELKVLNIYSLERTIEKIRMSQIGNDKLLFHGTPPHNLVGILSRGLLPASFATIADKTKPLNHGIYFSSSVGISLEFTKPTTTRGSRFLLVCWVALGNVHVATSPPPSYFTAPPSGFDSIKCLGPKNEEEYIIFNPSQQRLQYLVEVSLPEEPLQDLPKDFTSGPWIAGALMAPDEPAEDWESQDKPIQYGLFSEGSLSSFPLEGFHVRAELIDMVARVSLFQVYKNPNATTCEGKFVFPLDLGSAVCGFEVYINDKHIVGKVREKSEARAEYYEAVKKGHGGYLFEQESPDVFSVSLGNLPPGATVLIKITYVLELAVEQDLIRFSVPSIITPKQEYISQHQVTQESTNTSHVIWDEDTTAFTVQVALEDMYEEITKLFSPTHPIRVKKTQTRAFVELAPEATLSSHGFTLLIGLAQVHVPRMWLEAAPPEKPNEVKASMLTFYPDFPATPNSEQTDIVLLVDVSNSMSGRRFQLARKAACRFLERLDSAPTCRFNIIAFGTVFRECFPMLVAPSCINVSAAIRFVEELKPNHGMSNLARPFPLLHLYASCSPLNLVIISDGFLSSPNTIANEFKQMFTNARIFTLGVGKVVNKHLLQQLALAGAGCFEHIDKDTNLVTKVDQQFRRCQQPSLSNVTIEWQQEGSKVAQAPHNIPAIFSGQRVVIYGFVQNCYMATLKAEIEGRTYETVVSTSPLYETSGTIIHTLTAKAFLDEWQEGARVNVATTSVSQKLAALDQRSLMVTLSLRYNLVSPLTSFVAIEERPGKAPSKDPCLIEKILAEASVDHLEYMEVEEQPRENQKLPPPPPPPETKRKAQDQLSTKGGLTFGTSSSSSAQAQPSIRGATFGSSSFSIRSLLQSSNAKVADQALPFRSGPSAATFMTSAISFASPLHFGSSAPPPPLAKRKPGAASPLYFGFTPPTPLLAAKKPEEGMPKKMKKKRMCKVYPNETETSLDPATTANSKEPERNGGGIHRKLQLEPLLVEDILWNDAVSINTDEDEESESSSSVQDDLMNEMFMEQCIDDGILMKESYPLEMEDEPSTFKATSYSERRSHKPRDYEKLYFKPKTASKQDLLKFLEDNLGQRGGAPYFQALHKYLSVAKEPFPEDDLITEVKKKCNNIFPHIFYAKIHKSLKEEGSSQQSFSHFSVPENQMDSLLYKMESHFVKRGLLREPLSQVLQDKGLMSFGKKISQEILVASWMVATCLYVLATYLACCRDRGAEPNLEQSFRLLSALDGRIVHFGGRLAEFDQENPAVYSALGLGYSWETSMLEYLNI